jgi:hypothetical protein
MDGPVGEALGIEASSARGGGRRRLRRELVAMATDALVVWDILSIATAGYLCALVYVRFLSGPVVSLVLPLSVWPRFLLRPGSRRNDAPQRATPLVAERIRELNRDR